jgi:serine/threonine protein kinase
MDPDPRRDPPHGAQRAPAASASASVSASASQAARASLAAGAKTTPRTPPPQRQRPTPGAVDPDAAAHDPERAAATAGAARRLLRLDCDPKLTGSYGTLYSFRDEEAGVGNAVWRSLVQNRDRIEVLNEARVPYGERFAARILECLAQRGVAVKIIKVHYEVPKKMGYSTFLEETSKIKLVRRTLGPDHFDAYSSVRSVGKGGPFAFILRTRDPAELMFTLAIGDKTHHTGQLHMILQEKGECDLRTLMRRDPGAVNLMELDRNLRRFFGFLHGSDVVHKDLKPANVVYFPGSEVRFKVIDYGLCSELRDRPSAWKAKGTPGYMSPVFLMCNNNSLARIREHYMNKRVHNDFYFLALDKYKERNGSPVHRNLCPDALYRTILKKNDEFAYAIMLLELQYMAGRKQLYLKNRLRALLDYDRMYFHGGAAASSAPAASDGRPHPPPVPDRPPSSSP